MAFICAVTSARAHDNAPSVALPSEETRNSIIPAETWRTTVMDREAPQVAAAAREVHNGLRDPVRIAAIEARLLRVRETGDAENFFTASEWRQLGTKLEELREMEREFLEQSVVTWGRRWLRLVQNVVTSLGSRAPRGSARREFEAGLERVRDASPYLSPAPAEYGFGEMSAGEVLLKFSDDEAFRDRVLVDHEVALPWLRFMSLMRSQEDTWVKRITIHEWNTTAEYRVFEARTQPEIPNLFQAKLDPKVEKQLELMFASELYFPRLSHSTVKGRNAVVEIVPIKKGRSMEPVIQGDRIVQRGFWGDKFVRGMKLDEVEQIRNVLDGSLWLFIGPRSIPLSEQLAIADRYPELAAVMGILGYSVSGGRTQLSVARTSASDVEGQAAKVLATLMDFEDLALKYSAGEWFDMNFALFGRAVIGGVGAGGSAQSSAKPSLFSRTCTKLFSKLRVEKTLKEIP